MSTVSGVKLCVLLVFDTPQIHWPLPEQQHSVAHFPSTRGAAATQLPISTSYDLHDIRGELVTAAEKLLNFAVVENYNLWTYFFGISVVQIVLDVERAPADESELELWDSLTDDLQRSISHHVEKSLNSPVTDMWSSTMYVGETGETSSPAIRRYLPEVTKTLPIAKSGFIDDGLCGIGMSWVEVDLSATPKVGEPSPLSVVTTTVRDAVAFCAVIYSLYDHVVAEYGTWLQKPNPRNRSSAATRFRYVESIRVHRNLRLGPNERGLNDGLWEVWGMPAMVSSLESLVDRFENETQSATQIAIGRAQNALAVTAALIVPFVSVDEIESFLGQSILLSRTEIVIATGVTEAAIALAIYVVARRRRRR
jgi:hypothetical protein